MTEEKQNNTTVVNAHPSYRFLIVWFKTALFGFCVYSVFSIYLFFRYGYLSIYFVNEAIAETGVVLLGLSMILSSVCYFWNFADSKLIYRKYLGVGGLICGIMHALVILLFLGDEFSFPAYFLGHWLAIGFGLLAIILFIFIVIISTKKMIARIGGQRWRRTIRYVGYVGYVFVVIHFSIQKYPEWVSWMSTRKPNMLPPLSIFTGLFAITVIIMRLVLWRALKTRSNTNINTNEHHNII